MKKTFYGWFIVGASFFTMMMTVGVVIYGMPFFYEFFKDEFGWTDSEATRGVLIGTLLVLPLGGLVVHRFSPRKLIMCGLVLELLALNCFGLMEGNLVLYCFIWCILMVGFLFSGLIPNQVILSRWFHKLRGTAFGFAYLGLGLGGAISQKYVALPLIEAYGWRTALMGIGGLLLFLFPVLIFLVRDRPEDKGLYADGVDTPPQDTKVEALPFSHLLRQKSFWVLAFSSFCSIGAIGSIDHNLPLLIRRSGLSLGVVANTHLLRLGSSLAGRVVMGRLADRVSKKYVMIAAYLLVALPVPLLFYIDRPGILETFAVIFGFGMGADFMLIPLMAAEIFGANSLARAMGIIWPFDSVGQAICPNIVAYLRDRSGSYKVGLSMVFALALIGAVGISLLPKKRPEPEV
tara:strand:- start:217 stop:1428 length:1212 start_codon:yes stop_codon:yes gene_type:complete